MNARRLDPADSPAFDLVLGRGTKQQLDMRGVVSYTDFFVICTGNTERQTQAIEDAIYQGLKHSDEAKILPGRVEGRSQARWILMDYFDCVVHIFTPAARDYYRLEVLWGEVPALEVG